MEMTNCMETAPENPKLKSSESEHSTQDTLPRTQILPTSKLLPEAAHGEGEAGMEEGKSKVRQGKAAKHPEMWAGRELQTLSTQRKALSCCKLPADPSNTLLFSAFQLRAAHWVPL